MNRPVRTSTAILLFIGAFDLVTSVLWLHLGFGEGNPLFRALLPYGSLAFVLAKLAMLFGPVLLLEYARRSHPTSAEQGTWVAIAAYAVLYALNLRRLFGV